MTRGVWAVIVALSLGNFVPLAAQETTWRSTTSLPAARVPAAQTGANTTAVQLEKPVPITRASSASLDFTPRPFPTAYRDAATLPVERQPSSAQRIPTVVSSGSVIAASVPSPGLMQRALEHADDGAPADQWAMDWQTRQARRPGNSGLREAANWDQTFPSDSPPAVAMRGPTSQNPSPNYGPPQGQNVQQYQPIPQAQSIQQNPAPPPVHGLTQNHSHAQPQSQSPPLAAQEPTSAFASPWDVASPDLAQGQAPGNRYYARGEYLLWWMKNDNAPPLITTGQNFNALNRDIGALDQPDTVSLFDGKLTNNPYSGGRFTFGMYLNDCGDKAIELSGFFLGDRSTDVTVSSAQVMGILTRPFFAANPSPSPLFPRETVEFVAFPGVSTGKVTINAPSRMWGLTPDFVCKLCCGCDYQVNGIAGGRYLNLRESLTITEDLVTAADSTSALGPNSRVIVTDSFATKNEFFGAEVGVSGRMWYGRCDLEGTAKVAIGSTKQTVEINGGQTVFRANGQVQRFTGGLLALPSNIGHESRDKISFVPELGVTLGYNLTSQLRLSVGYNFLYWSSVVRPGDQVNRNLDVLQIPNFPIDGNPQPTSPTQPVRLFNTTDFWVHGLTVGAEFRF